MCWQKKSNERRLESNEEKKRGERRELKETIANWLLSYRSGQGIAFNCEWDKIIEIFSRFHVIIIVCKGNIFPLVSDRIRILSLSLHEDERITRLLINFSRFLP